MTRGVVIIGLGLYRKWAESLPEKLKTFGLDDPCTVITAPHPECNIKPSGSWGFTETCARWHKVHLYDISRYQETLFIDADVLPFGDLSSVWSNLAAADMAACVEEVSPWMDGANFRDSLERSDTESLMGPLSSVPHFNSGVILFRKTPSVRSFFDEWRIEWRGEADQPAFSRASFRSGVSLASLPGQYNRMPPHGASKNDIKAMIPKSLLIHFWDHKPILWDWK